MTSGNSKTLWSKPVKTDALCGSVTSPGLIKSEDEVRRRAPWCQQFNGVDHGYALLTLDANQLVTEYRRSDVSVPTGATVAFERFTQPSGTGRVTREVLAPSTPR